MADRVLLRIIMITPSLRQTMVPMFDHLERPVSSGQGGGLAPGSPPLGEDDEAELRSGFRQILFGAWAVVSIIVGLACVLATHTLPDSPALKITVVGVSSLPFALCLGNIISDLPEMEWVRSNVGFAFSLALAVVAYTLVFFS